MFVPVMWSIWCVLVASVAALHVYRSNLTRDEEDQIFLDESFEHEKQAQAAIVTKVNKVEPVLHGLQWAVAAVTLIVIGYYLYEMVVVQLHLL